MSFLRSVSWVGAGTGISIVVSILSVPAIISGYVPSEVTYFLWLWTLLGVMNLADFGLSRGVSKFVSSGISITKVLLYGYIYALIVSSVLGGVLFILGFIINIEFWNELPQVVKIISIALFIISFLTFPLSGVVEGLGKFRDIVIIKNIGNIIAYCIPIIFAIYKVDIYITLTFSVILSRLIIFISICLLIYRALSANATKLNNSTKGNENQSYNINFFFSFCTSVGIVSFMGVIFLYWDRSLILTSLTHSDVVSYVAFSEMLIKLYAIPGILSGVIFQFVSAKFDFDKKVLLILIPKFLLACSFLFAVFSVVFFISIKSWVFSYVFKHSLNKDLELLFSVMVFFTVLNCFNMLAMTIAQALNNHKKIFYSQFILLPIFILISYVLAKSGNVKLAISVWFTRIPVIYIYTVFLNYKSIKLRGSYEGINNKPTHK
ncbi:lipopolysaccharide biosynthesis protein [Serratia sp. J2]|uniref:lipopolysaccharide biosynthesis protein n=1 Tax=Serratia sp. J2 TaxID=3386551 RepID=UPI00391720EC